MVQTRIEKCADDFTRRNAMGVIMSIYLFVVRVKKRDELMKYLPRKVLQP